MADFDTSTVAPGVTQRNHSWGFILTGTKAALITAGVCKGNWFVSEIDRDKQGRVKRSKNVTRNGRSIRTCVPAKGPCEVWVRYSSQELGAKPKEMLSSNSQRLLDLGAQVSAIAGLVTEASHTIHAKMARPKALKDSSKLGRAMDDLDYAKRDISEVLKKLQALIDFGGDDDDDNDNDDHDPVAHSPSPLNAPA